MQSSIISLAWPYFPAKRDCFAKWVLVGACESDVQTFRWQLQSHVLRAL